MSRSSSWLIGLAFLLAASLAPHPGRAAPQLGRVPKQTAGRAAEQDAQATPSVRLWDLPPFTATAEQLRRAAARADGTSGTSYLLEDTTFTVGDHGETTSRYRRVFAVHDAAAVEAWQILRVQWAPWFEDASIIEARVLDRTGRFHTLDPRTVERAAASPGASHTISDRRLVSAPLPSLAKESIVELVVTVRERAPLFAAGSVHQVELGQRDAKVLQTRVVIDAPASLALRFDERLSNQVHRTSSRAAGREVRTYVADELPAFGGTKISGDTVVLPSVGFSTGKSWQAVANAYDAILRQQIARGPLPKEVAIARGRTPRETIDRAVAFVHRELRYTGLELGENEITPWTPAQVWQRRYGDCKDLATFLVALLDRAGVRAHVALLAAGPGEPLRPTLPGLGTLDHAIVYVPSERLWIDPTVELARAGQLGRTVADRPAVVISPSTKRPIRTHPLVASDNRIVEHRTIDLAAYGGSSIREVSRYSGLRELHARYDFRSATKATLKDSLGKYAATAYGGTLKHQRMTAVDDLGQPFTIELDIEDAHTAYSDEISSSLSISLDQLFQALPFDLRNTDDTGASAAAELSGTRQLEPHIIEWHYEIKVPEGFRPLGLPSMERTLGPASYTQRFSFENGVLRGTLRFVQPNVQVTPAEHRALRIGVSEVLAQSPVNVRLQHQIAPLLADRPLEAARVAATLAAARPRDAGALARLSYTLSAAGLGEQAIEVAEQLVATAPDRPWAHGALAAALRHNALGVFGAPGFHRQRALAALAKAHALDRSSNFYAIQRGVLLASDDNAEVFAGDLAGAARALETMTADDEDDVGFIELTALLALDAPHRIDQAAAKRTTPALRAAYRLAAASDTQELERRLADIPESERGVAVPTAYLAALQARRYDRLRRIAKIGKAYLTLTPQVEKNIQSARRLDDEPTTEAELFAKLFAARTVDELTRWLSRDTIPASAAEHLLSTFAPAREDLQSALQALGAISSSELSADLFHLGVLLTAKRLGKAGPLERWDVGRVSAASPFNLLLYTTREDGRLRLLAASSVPQGNGPAVLRMVAAGQLEDAREVLDWIHQDLGPGAWRATSIAGPQFGRFWSRGARGDAKLLRLAAATAIADIDADRARAMYRKECPPSGALADACGYARAALSLREHRLAEAEAALAKLHDTAPHPELVYARARRALSAGDWKSLDALSTPNDPVFATPVELIRAQGFLRRGQESRALAILDRVAKSSVGSSDINNGAWLSLFARREASRALSLYESALGGVMDDSFQHTLATLYAAAGRYREARDALRLAARLRGHIAPVDYLVYGRLAAAAGLPLVARDAYLRVIDGAESVEGGFDGPELAKRWLAELGPLPERSSASTDGPASIKCTHRPPPRPNAR